MSCDRTRRPSAETLVALVLLLAATPAWAHVQPGQAAGFLTGVKHPISGLDHVAEAWPPDCPAPPR